MLFDENIHYLTIRYIPVAAAFAGILSKDVLVIVLMVFAVAIIF